MKARSRPRLAVCKFASCDGCQLSVLDCEDELLTLVDRVEIASFPEASRAVSKGPYDLALVEGSITTPHDAERIHDVRRSCRVLITIGACATSGGLQALRNFADVKEYARAVYPSPEYLNTLGTSTPIAQHVRVDLELRGCPVSKTQLLEVLGALLNGRRPQLETGSVCGECKRQGVTCVMVAAGQPCLGPVTQTGCGALCPRFCRGCYGCFGPTDSPNTRSLARALEAGGLSARDLTRVFRQINAWAPDFRTASEFHERSEEEVR